MNDIVAKTGLSKGGVYHHFKSKNDIVLAVVQAFSEMHLYGLTEVLNSPGSVSDRAMQAVEQYRKIDSRRH